MKITITADGRNLSATTNGQPLTSGSVGIEAAFVLSADYDGLAVTAVFSAGETQIDVVLTNLTCIVPWEVLQEAKTALYVGIVGKNGSGEIVIPTVWGRVGMIECGTVADGLDPEDPTPDIAAQILEQAREALDEAAETKEAAAQSAQDAADDADRAEAAKQAIEDLGVEAHEDPDGPSVEKTVDPETGAVTLAFGFKPAGVTEVNGQAGAVSLDLDDIPDGAQYVRPTPAQVQQIGANADDIDAIEAKIPPQASATNQLADKDFVNSSINSSAAFFRGAFPTRAALFAVAWQTSDPTGANYVSNNDYAYVADDETHNDEAWRYLYVLQPGGTDNGWQPQFRVNESPLTAAQLAALNSGATAENIASIADKYVLPAGGMPSADMSDAVRASLQKADTALQTVPDTYRTAAEQDVIDQAQDTEIRDLKSAMVHNDDCLFVTSDSITTDGITIEKISNTSFRVFGVATAARYITLFNNYELVRTSSQTVAKIVPPGECEVAITTNLPTIKLRYTAGDTWSSAVPLENGNVVFTENVGVSFLTNKNVDYGTSESPTIVDIRIKRKVVSAEPWLLSPSGGDDRPAIWLNLYCYGRCDLTEGIYHTTTLFMPENTILSGCGNKTVLITAESIGINMTHGCVVRSLALDGGGQDDVIPSVDGGRSGIVIDVADVRRVRIDNCYIHGFSGSAIVARDIGTGIRTDIVISRCNLWYNFRGIYLRRNAEFIMVSDCNICCNYYGVLNRGGNNKFSNCDIDSNIINAQIDQDEGSNGGHGSMVGCSFNHSNNRENDGYSLIIKNTGRELFSGCNFHYGKTRLENTNGNIFSGCGYGTATGIEIDGGACSIFNSCCFISTTQTPVTRTNNTTAVFANCYTRQGAIFTGN